LGVPGRMVFVEPVGVDALSSSVSAGWLAKAAVLSASLVSVQNQHTVVLSLYIFKDSQA
jgi:hypothetical protein